jgi:hypothetical protein
MIPRKPETIAWIVLWASFVACVALAIAVPAAGRWYMANATDGQEATLEIIGGTVLVQDAVSRSWIGASNKMRLREGDGIRTDEVSRALVTLFDGSPIFLSPRTEVVIVRSQVSKFDPKVNFVTLRVQRGYVRVAVAPQPKASQVFLIQTPHANGALLKDGSYSVEVTESSSQIAVREGEAKVFASGAEVSLKLGQRTTILPGKAPSGPEKATKALVANGDFRQGLAGWKEYSILEVPGDVAASVAAEEVDGQGVVHLVRQGSRNTHAENGIVQMINRDVTDFLFLKFSMDVYISNQSLSGGGFRGSEYPAMVQIRYRDVDGNEQIWVRGFYYHNRDNYSTINGEQVLQEKWYPIERAILGPGGITPRPFYIISIQLSSSGWDYDSMIRAVNLVGE